ncbi:MAG: S-layer homology domain-containing protein, partial [Byssovorax cruenta]
TPIQLADTAFNITTFGEDEQGELYLADYATGKIYQLTSTIFEDVPWDYWAWDYIERLYKAGVTSGCSSSPLLYCPMNTVTRDQMAVFLLKAKHGPNYIPPKAIGVFEDVPVTYWAADWIEQLAKEGVTAGCSVTPSLYCPGTPVSRDQMAVFLVRNFNLP